MSFWTDHLPDESVKFWHLVQIDLPTPVYLTDCDIDIVTTTTPPGSHTWTAARPNRIGSVSTRQLDAAGGLLEVADSDGALAVAIVADGGSQGRRVVIHQAGFLSTNASAIPDATRQIYEGPIESARFPDSGNDTVSIGLGQGIQFETILSPTRRVKDLLRS